MNVVVLTGAGISAESGLKTFRDGDDGLWEGHRIEDVATPEGFLRDPAHVHEFYNGLRRRLHDGDVVPNAAHRALVRLEQHTGPGFHLITQNIDDLHQRAGSRSVTAMHGELTKIRHVGTGEIRECHDDVVDSNQWRPHVVWFGEQTIGLAETLQKLAQADLFLAVGTSGTVYPANQFVALARSAGAVTINVDLNPEANPLFDFTYAGPATALLPPLVDHLMEPAPPADHPS